MCCGVELADRFRQPGIQQSACSAEDEDKLRGWPQRSRGTRRPSSGLRPCPLFSFHGCAARGLGAVAAVAETRRRCIGLTTAAVTATARLFWGSASRVQSMELLLASYGARVEFRRCVDPGDWLTMSQSLKTKYAARHGIGLIGQMNAQIGVVTDPAPVPMRRRLFESSAQPSPAQPQLSPSSAQRGSAGIGTAGIFGLQ